MGIFASTIYAATRHGVYPRGIYEPRSHGFIALECRRDIV